jgi:hypothetical protein
VYGFGRMVLGVWFWAYGFEGTVLGVWFWAYGFKHMVLSVWFWAYGFGRMVLAYGFGHIVSSTRGPKLKTIHPYRIDKSIIRNIIHSDAGAISATI